MWRGPACSCPDLLTECSPELPGAEISSNYSKIWKQNVHRIENRIYTCHNILLTFQTFLSLFPAAGCGMEAMMHCWHQEKGMWEERRRWYPTSNLHYQRLNLRGLENTPSQIRLLPAVCCRRWDLTAALQFPAAPNQYPDISEHLRSGLSKHKEGDISKTILFQVQFQGYIYVWRDYGAVILNDWKHFMHY